MARKKGIPGLSFSWKRALGISAAKSRVSRKIGVPLTKSGRQRKFGAMGCSIPFISMFILLGFGIGLSEKLVNNFATEKPVISKKQSELSPANQSELTKANNSINIVWKGTTKAIRKKLLPDQRAWLKQREKDCKAQENKDSCMAAMTYERIEVLKQKIASMKGM